VLCTCGPDDPPYEEQHREFAVAFVIGGMFEHRGPGGRTLMTPGTAMLGNAGACFECSHTHARGDRCISFWYSEEYFDQLLADAARGTRGFAVDALPPLRETAAIATRAAAAISRPDDDAWDELAAQVAIASIALMQRTTQTPSPQVSSRVESKVADAVRLIEAGPEAALSLDSLARQAGLSPYHFLRVFSAVSGLTPHQYVRRARLRRAAVRLLVEPTRIIDIALDSGFHDVSNFNHSFRVEFGVSPRRYRSRSLA